MRNKAAVGESVLRAAMVITVRQNSLFARCFTCLARQLMVTETMVREVAQVLIVPDGFALDQGICYTCHRVEDLVVPVEHGGPPAIRPRVQGEKEHPDLAAALSRPKRGRRLLLPREEVFDEEPVREREPLKPQPETQAEPEFRVGGSQLPRP
jgi:hypothetical protein